MRQNFRLMSHSKTYSRYWRLRKAYSVAGTVMFSYLWLTFIRKFRGPAWHERALQELHIRNAERVKQAILELKGLFIKLGQLLSIMGNFLPAAFQKPLEALQDQIPARPLDEVRDRIFMEFGAYPETIFARFDEKPLAAASIGQAHRAQLHDGTEVVVKVQHLHIERIAAVDLEIIRRLTAIVSFFYHIRGMNYMYTQIKKMIEEELDFYREAANMQLIGKNLESEPGIVIPEVHTSCSTSRVMTTTWHSGVKISDLEQIDAWGLDRRELATSVLRVYSKQCVAGIFENGVCRRGISRRSASGKYTCETGWHACFARFRCGGRNQSGTSVGNPDADRCSHQERYPCDDWFAEKDGIHCGG